MVNALGSVFVSQLVAERGARPAEVVRAYRIAREVVGAEADWETIEDLEGKVEAEVQAELMGGVDGLVDAVTRWYLSDGGSDDMESTIEGGREGFRRLLAAAPKLGGEELHGARREVAERLVAGGVPEELATAHALRPGLVHAPAVTAVAAATERPVEDVARVFVLIGEELPLNEVEAAFNTLPAMRRMERWALQAVREDARRVRRDIAENALLATPELRPRRGARALPDRPRRGDPPPRRLHAHALARGFDGHGRPRAGGPPAALAGRVAQSAPLVRGIGPGGRRVLSGNGTRRRSGYGQSVERAGSGPDLTRP